MDHPSPILLLIAALILGAFTLLILLPYHLRRRPQPPDLPSPDELRRAPPLLQALARQCISPDPITDGPVLLPILAFQLYPPPLRDLYERSRDLDRRMLYLLLEHPLNPELPRHLTPLHHTTRATRRALLQILLQPHLNQPHLRHELHHQLDHLHHTLLRLERP